VSVGLLKGELLVDLDYDEDSGADVDLNVVSNDAGELLEVQGTAEHRPFSPGQLAAMVAAGVRGCGQLHLLQKAALVECAARDLAQQEAAAKSGGKLEGRAR